MSATAETVTEQTTTTQPDPAVESKARTMGWVPKDQWRGNPSVWQPASEYVQRGEQLLPYLRNERASLETQLNAEREARARLETDLKGAQEAINTLQSFKEDVSGRIESADEAALARQLSEAREAGDTLKEVQVLRQLAKAEEPTKPEVKPAAVTPPPPKPRFEDTPEGRSFVASNPWWTEDPVMRAGAMALGQQMAERGELNNLTPAQRIALIGERTVAYFNKQSQPSGGPSRVESGRSSDAGGLEGEHSFADLPTDARDACKRQAKFLVGPGKRFKTEVEWQRHYIQSYFTDAWGSMREKSSV